MKLQQNLLNTLAIMAVIIGVAACGSDGDNGATGEQG